MVVTIILLIASALVSGSEVAFFSLSPQLTKSLVKEQSPTSESILEMIQSPRELLATILISNNFINVAIILLSSLISAEVFLPTNLQFGSMVIASSTIVFLINVVLITFLILLFGEVVPKVYASKYPVELLKITVRPLQQVNTLLVKSGVTPLLLKTTHLFERGLKEKAQNVTVDDLQHALDLTSKKDLEQEDHRILEGVVKFGNTDVKQIMMPRVKAVFVELGTPFQEVVQLIRETRFSRIPVFQDSIDVVKGVLYAKDLLPHFTKENFDWEQVIREPFFVPENKKIDDLLTEFQSRKTHIALVVDEYGGVSGLVSLEDVIEEIVGDISDEFDDEDLFFTKLSENEFLFEGQTSLNNMYRAMRIKGEEFESAKGEADSIAGFILEIAGRIPVKGEVIRFSNYIFTIDAADKRRIKSVKVKINPIENAE